MKAKAMLKLCIVAVLIVFVSFLALNGAQVGKYILKPVGSAISLGLDLRGGISTEYIVTDTSAENYDSLLEGTVSALRSRLTNAGFTEASVAVQGSDRILVEIPDVDDPEEIASIIGTPAHLEFRDPDGNVVFEGKDIKSASAQWTDETRTMAGVQFELNDEAADAFAEATAQFIGESIEIWLDDEMISAPIVNGVIVGGSGMITSDNAESTNESVEWAENLAMLIQSGALPLDIEEIETRAISATLGAEAIDGAVIAGIVGVALILLFMIAVYRLPGVAAGMALLIYILIVFYTMAIVGVQLTLQGVAGILLGVGMAVDANVVIFERFREELKDGRTPINAVKFGFRNAGRAVADSNITTLIAAAVLLGLGTGTIKGFATTLLISVIASLFTAVVVTRWLLNLICALNIQAHAAYSRRDSKLLFKKNAFTGKYRICIALSGAIIIVALVLQIAGLGLNMGVDFTGGSLLNYSVGEDFDTADVEKILVSAGFEGSQITKAAPSDASIALQSERISAENTAIESGEAHVHEDGSIHYGAHSEGETDEAAETAETNLDLDKSNISADGLTDLQIRLKLADESEGLEAALCSAVSAQFAEAEMRSFDTLTASMQMELDMESQPAGSFVAAYQLDGEISADTLKAALSENYSVESVSILPCEADDSCNVRIVVALNDQAAQVRALLESQMSEKYPHFAFVSIDHVSAVAGRDLLANAVKALVIAFACMLVYIALRFDLFSGLAALLGLLHDVLIMFAFMVFFRSFYQVNSSFIAAILTIVGYSINNTIIVFDRIRETNRKSGFSAMRRSEIVDASVSATLSRTLNTTLTTLVTLVALYGFGVESIREFAFPLIIGMLAGTYSSVLLSGQTWAVWADKAQAKKQTRGKKA